MKYTDAVIGGISYPLLFNGDAKFDVEELCGAQIFAAILPSSREGYRNLCAVAAILAAQAELCRRVDGYDRSPIPTADQLRARATPAELPGLYNAVMDAILRGYGRELDEDELDEGLAELSKKKE